MLFEIEVNVPNLEHLVEDKARDILRDITFETEREMATRHASGNRTGKSYRVPGTRGTFYIASAAGEPPAVRTSNLLTSIQAEFSDAEMEGTITLNDYGWYLDQGTDRIAARPWITPTLDEVIAQYA